MTLTGLSDFTFFQSFLFRFFSHCIYATHNNSLQLSLLETLSGQLIFNFGFGKDAKCSNCRSYKRSNLIGSQLCTLYDVRACVRVCDHDK